MNTDNNRLATANADLGEESASAQGPKYWVNIEGSEYAWDHDSITAADVRELAGFDSGQPIVEVDLIHNTEVTLREGEPVPVKPGHGFGKKVKFQRG
jgi:hypothetical protein